ncbi:hypothetical protein F2P81_008406 [Scophthalmus maximus]|uniref:Uncharacterized protein n=1 Tax=Scophthalmus maximus TaxID=52904 RepID=A0A6A4TB76_SCOMX|nr:hypothetical protein F2P81_008406 [Scophthalmus maximus]
MRETQQKVQRIRRTEQRSPSFLYVPQCALTSERGSTTHSTVGLNSYVSRHSQYKYDMGVYPRLWSELLYSDDRQKDPAYEEKHLDILSQQTRYARGKMAGTRLFSRHERNLPGPFRQTLQRWEATTLLWHTLKQRAAISLLNVLLRLGAFDDKRLRGFHTLNTSQYDGVCHKRLYRSQFVKESQTTGQKNTRCRRTIVSRVA